MEYPKSIDFCRKFLPGLFQAVNKKLQGHISSPNGKTLQENKDV
jgi:hypothetical protein